MLSLSNFFAGVTFLTAVAAIPLISRASLWPDPEPCTGNCSWIHDPNVIKSATGTYYRFSTSGNIAIATAPSLTGPWSYKGAMLPGGPAIHVADNQDTWAPDVSLIDGTYYAFYAVSYIGYQGSEIGVATSTFLDPGTWTDHGSIGLPKSSSYNLIDPNLFQESGSSPIYFSFGSGWQGVFQSTLNSPPVTASGAAATNLAYNSTVPPGQNFPSVTEGSYQFWWQNGGDKWYYLFFSSGACCNTPPNLAATGDEYKIMVCRSTSQSGPFFDQAGRNCLTQNGGTLILGSHDNVYAPGGQGVMYDSTLGRPVIYYHYVNPTIGYKAEDFLFGFNYLDFSSGWPVIVS
ncbi:glycoside hydrolase family 43 protein [Lepidopterella palustris CBS 459.81]|uniref:Arabinan endo-1,5-alpha-L-arabinosidase n=1 Tax=Lepidopterella palustris CBS 459.81 TaxID=1314670 RepID=A0A8E2E7Y7_9PEZI|nr:glycoside hydrolase family 43 protein [Lepidopterella palustris CBS 459.81]